MVYFVLTVAVIYPFADEMMSLFVNSGEQDVIANTAQFMRIANWFYPALGILVILRYSIQGLGYSNLSMMSGVMEMIARCGVSFLVSTCPCVDRCLLCRSNSMDNGRFISNSSFLLAFTTTKNEDCYGNRSE